MKEKHRKIKYYITGGNNGSIGSVLIPDGDNPKGPFGKNGERYMIRILWNPFTQAHDAKFR